MGVLRIPHSALSVSKCLCLHVCAHRAMRVTEKLMWIA